MIKINRKLLPLGSDRRSGGKVSNVVFFCDHDTGNANSTAQNNVDFFYRTANDGSFASSHIFVDDVQALECIPCSTKGKVEKAWHVLYQMKTDNLRYGDDANDIAIGLELCYFPNDKARSLKAYNNYIAVAAYLCYLHGTDPSKRSGHFELDPERRTDPNNALKYIGRTYADMKADILTKYNSTYIKTTAVVANDSAVSKYAKDAQVWVIAKAVSDGTNPKDNIIRGQLFRMLYRYFKGVKESSVDDAISFVKAKEYSDGTRIDDALTRVELWCILYRSIGEGSTKANWQAESKAWVVSKSVSDGTNPLSKVTRQDAWVMLYRASSI